MAVFLMNVCKFNGCGITFRTLGDLIQHIEDTHIDFDPRALEKQELQQPPCIPISCVLRFFTDSAKKENLDYLKKQKRSHSPAVSICSTTPSGSEFDEEELVSESEDSNDSWTTQEEFSSEFILRYGSRIVGNANPNEEKPFACPVPGCKKRYKNINGIKYHAKNGHRKDARVKKAYRCQCGKSYKTAKGLRVHAHVHHNGGMPAAIVESIPAVGDPLQVGATAMSAGLAQRVASVMPPSPYSSVSLAACNYPQHPETPPPLCPLAASASLALPHSLLPTTPPPTPTSSSPATHTTTSPCTYALSNSLNLQSQLSMSRDDSPLTSAGQQQQLFANQSYTSVAPLSPSSPFPIVTP